MMDNKRGSLAANSSILGSYNEGNSMETNANRREEEKQPESDYFKGTRKS